MIAGDKETDAYLENEDAFFSQLRTSYWRYANEFYPRKKSGLIVKCNSGENLLRYNLDARIEDDSSDGVNEVRMFCFDLLLLVNKKSKIQ